MQQSSITSFFARVSPKENTNSTSSGSKIPKKEVSARDETEKSRKKKVKESPAGEQKVKKSPRAQKKQSPPKKNNEVTEDKLIKNATVVTESSSSPDTVKPVSSNEKNDSESIKKVSTSPVKDEDDVNVKRRNSKRARILSSDESSDERSIEEISPLKTGNAKKQKLVDEERSDKQESVEESKVEMETTENKQIKDENKEDIDETKGSQNEKKDDKKLASIFGQPSGTKKDDLPKYNPNVTNYDPIKHATWKHKESVPYSALARTFDEIENVSARLKMIEILSNYFRSVIVLTPEDLLPSVYLCLNKIAPAYEGVELGIADTIVMKAIAQSTGRTLAQVKADVQEIGDFGLVAEKSKSNQKMLFKPARLTVRGVFEKLKEIAKMSGSASQTKKIEKIQSMFVACQDEEARFLIRSLAGKLRIGLAEQSVLLALALASTKTPPSKDYPPKVLDKSKTMSSDAFKAEYETNSLLVKTAYCECPCYDEIIPVIIDLGINQLPKHCHIRPGIPLKPMLAHPTKGVQEVLERFDNLKFTCEWKYDGERAQIHIDGSSISIFSRNQENNTSKYPDIIHRIDHCKTDKVQSCIMDSEVVAWDKEKKQILPFQILSTRKRKDAVEEDIKVQVCVYMFDLLYLNGESLVTKPFIERRILLREHFKEVEGEWCFAKSIDTQAMEEVQDFLEESVKGNCEGLMVKTLEKDATYEIAKRSRKWLKLKKDYLDGVGDTLDVVVIGGYLGKGKRTGTYGGFLLACYDKDNEEFQSICKIGTGFSEEALQKHSEFLKQHVIPQPKPYYRFDGSLNPDHWFDAMQVWEIKCADLSLSPVHRAAIGIVDPEKGISLRFPRFIRIRDDKNVEDATTSQQIAHMYSSQEQVKNQQNDAKDNDEDFY
ncbi:unnamed protein product [Acanthoscelides obtectus]|uniref:DNA ligase n=1 Tax=Acanthoscelides obtectus TaxID=200917 RepID=A0A9P0M2P4_ACAOB|nr:unnamed protein product [Acanthoscelides obtectus]CAK1636233.1 DNA ligase 1 [Acanthoscelides obtectus]